MSKNEYQCLIHHFYTDPITGKDSFDEDGEIQLGWYWEIVNSNGETLSPLVGPYPNSDEATKACKKEWSKGTLGY